MEDKLAVAERILDAAEARMRRYGYTKTTMAEVAADCGMSAANLYRFFPGKADIAAALIERAVAEDRAEFARQMRAASGTAAQRFRRFILLELETTFARLDGEGHIVDLAKRMVVERPEIANRDLAARRASLRALLEEGNASGEFDIADPETAAEMIQVATLKVRYPQLSSRLDLPALRREAEGVVELLLRGVLRRGRVRLKG